MSKIWLTVWIWPIGPCDPALRDPAVLQSYIPLCLHVRHQSDGNFLCLNVETGWAGIGPAIQFWGTDPPWGHISAAAMWTMTALIPCFPEVGPQATPESRSKLGDQVSLASLPKKQNQILKYCSHRTISSCMSDTRWMEISCAWSFMLKLLFWTFLAVFSRDTKNTTCSVLHTMSDFIALLSVG